MRREWPGRWRAMKAAWRYALVLAAAGMAGCGQPGDRAPAVAAGAPAAQQPDREPIAPVAALEPGAVELAAEPEAVRWRLPEASVATEQWTAARRRVVQALAAGELIDDAEAAVPLLLAMRGLRPDDRWVAGQLQRAQRMLLQQADALLVQPQRQRQALAQVDQRLQVLAALGAAEAVLAPRQQALAEARERLALNRRGEAALRAGRLGVGGAGALADFSQVLARWPDDVRALQGMAAVESALLREAEAAAAAADFTRAGQLLARAAGLREPVGTVAAAQARIEQMRSDQLDGLYRGGLADIQTAAGLRQANLRLARARQIAGGPDRRVVELERRIGLATQYGLYAPGQVFRDRMAGGGHGPQMVVVPRGQFLMGAAALESGAVEAEQPVRTVRFERGYAMAATEVTVAQFGRFVADAQARPRATRRGHSTVYEPRTGNFIRRSGVDWRSDYLGLPAAPGDPVMHVSVRDAEAYAAWLGEQTGHAYRLPSEAEFEYALRAGRSGRYPWGDAPVPAPDSGNFTGDGDTSPTGRQWTNAFAGYADGWWGAAPVGRFSPNPFGLYDMEGNLSEWVADCWHASYRRAPSDGAAGYNPGCRQRVVRGANWANAPVQARAAWRWQQESDVTNARIGFRVVRGL